VTSQLDEINIIGTRKDVRFGRSVGCQQCHGLSPVHISTE